MPKQLSAHFEKVEPQEAVALINNNPNTEWVYIVNPPTDNHFPNKQTVGRIQHDNEGWFIGRGIWGAEEWWRIYGPSLLRCTYITWWVSCNEPVGNWTTIGAYVLRWTQIAQSHGKKVIAFNFAVGAFPAGDKEGDQWDVGRLVPAIAQADALGFHAYWLPGHWTLEHSWARAMLIWRYKEFMKLVPSQYQNKPIFITECGCDGLTAQTLGRPNEEKGWTAYYDSEAAYLQDLWKFQAGLDDRVVATFVFDMGAWSRWKSYELTLSLLQGIMQYNQIEEGGEEMECPIRVMCVDGLVRTMEVEEYLKAVVPSEVYPSWPTQVLEAQAICARSYAVAATKSSKHHYQGYDVCSKQCCQVYKPLSKHPSTTAAVDATKGIVGMIEEGIVARMFYSACCGGQTLNDWAPFYLRAIACPCGEHKTANGHGRGMCQWGAYYCVEDLKYVLWKEILAHYFNLSYRYDYGQGELVFPSGDEEFPVWESLITERLDALEIAQNMLYDQVEKLENWASSFTEGV